MTDNSPTYYVDYKPVTVTRYDGDPEPVNNLLNDLFLQSGVEVCPGQWIVQHEDGRVEVRNTEPPRVEKWEWAVSVYGAEPMIKNNEADARLLEGEDFPQGWAVVKRPVIRTGTGSRDTWTGPWQEANSK